MEIWRTALGIEDTKWQGIGKHLANITNNALIKSNKNPSDLANYLRFMDNEYIEPSYVEEYLSGSSSFGCFFSQYREELGINAKDIFRNASDEEAKKFLPLLEGYLTDARNLEAYAIFLTRKPGKELRDYVKEFLSTKREQGIAKMHKIDAGTQLIKAREFDLMVTRSSLGGTIDDKTIDLESWKEAYTYGTFGRVKNPVRLVYISCPLDICVDEFIPYRKPSEGERYELHQRRYHKFKKPLGGPVYITPEMKRQMQEKPDPLKRTVFDQRTYIMNTEIAFVNELLYGLPKLVLEA